MEASISLNDPLNLRDFVSAVTDHIREKGPAGAQPKNIVGFFSIMVTGSDNPSGRKNNVVVMLQKLLSGNIPYTAAAVQVLADTICAEGNDLDLLVNLSVVSDAILSCSDAEGFFRSLAARVNLRFFSPEEMEALNQLLVEKEYPSFLLALLKHGFATLYNIPYFFAERMFEEALTCDYDSPLRYSLMKTAAENGHRGAALEYGNYLSRFGRENAAESLRFFMMALPKPAAAWSVAYLIEVGWIAKPEQIAAFRSAFRVEEKFNSLEFIDHLSELDHISYGGVDLQKAETMLFIYKVYFYLAYQDFFKAFNSLSKLLGNGTIRIDAPNGAVRGEQLRIKYSRAAIRASNIFAINNEGNRLMLERTEKGLYEPTDTEERYMLDLLQLGADAGLIHSNYYMGYYLEYANQHDPSLTKNRERAKKYYHRAEELDLNDEGLGGKLWLRLGRISDSMDEKQRFFEKALAAKQWDAAYYLAEVEVRRYALGGQMSQLHLFNAESLLKYNLDRISPENKDLAEALYRAVKATGNREEGSEL